MKFGHPADYDTRSAAGRLGAEACFPQGGFGRLWAQGGDCRRGSVRRAMA
jgi:hypothetical protein